MSFWNQIQHLLKSFVAGARDTFDNSALGKLYNLSTSGALLEDAGAKYLGTNLTGAEREANEFTRSEREAAQAWTAEREDTRYQRQVADMQAAGLNPMMAAGGSPVSTASSSGGSSVHPSSGSLSDIVALASLGPQLKALKADTELKKADVALRNAEVENKREDTRGKKLANDFNEITINSRKEGIELENNLKHAQFRFVYKQMDKIEAEMTEIIEKAHTEQERQVLLRCESWLKNAEAKQIIELLPYNKALAEAKTDEARAAANLSRIHAAYQQKLLDSDYLDSIIEKAANEAAKSGSESDIAKYKADLTKIKTAIRTGNTSDLPDFSIWESLFTGRGALSAISNFLDNFNPLNGLLGG